MIETMPRSIINNLLKKQYQGEKSSSLETMQARRQSRLCKSIISGWGRRIFEFKASLGYI
jgi:hypothetical protein